MNKSEFKAKHTGHRTRKNKAHGEILGIRCINCSEVWGKAPEVKEALDG